MPKIALLEREHMKMTRGSVPRDLNRNRCNRLVNRSRGLLVYLSRVRCYKGSHSICVYLYFCGKRRPLRAASLFD